MIDTDRLRTVRSSRALGALGVLLIVALVVPFVIYSVPAVVGAEESYVVLTASMTPAISPGDAVVVDDVDAAEVAVGDVITFRRSATDEIPVTHRVIGVVETETGPAFRTQGDANEDPDGALVTPDRLVGEVVLTLPYVGFVVQFVNSPTGFLALVVVPVVLLVLSEAYEFVGRRRGADRATPDDESASADEPESDRNRAPEAGAAARPDAGGTAGGGDATLSFTTADLTLSSVLLVAFAVYGALVAWRLRDSLSIAVAVAVASVTLVTLGARFSATPAPARVGVATDGGDDLAAPTATLADDHVDLPRVVVASTGELQSMAARAGRPVVRDAEGTHYLLFGDVAYAASPERTGTAPDAGVESGPAAPADQADGERERDDAAREEAAREVGE